MTQWKRLIHVVFLAFMLCLLAGCSKTSSFTWQCDTTPGNLDPQTVSAPEDVIAVTHLFSGLFRLDENGTPQPDAALRWERSEDGLTYTFTLRPALYNGYRNKKCETPVTAYDYVFGLQRTFSPQTQSPWTDSLMALENAQAVLDGTLPANQLGAEALDDATLVLHLSHPDDSLLAALCTPGAMPCNQAFFENTKGRYGLGVSQVLGNGPFYLYNWTSSGLFLRRAGSGITALRLVTPAAEAENKKSKAPSQLVSSGEVSALLSQTAPTENGIAVQPYTDTLYALLFNSRNGALQNRQVRLALSAVARQTAADLCGDDAAQGLVPPACTLQGESYRSLAGPAAADCADPAAAFAEGLAQLGLSKAGGLNVLVPKGQGARVFGYINQAWQSRLNAFFTVTEAEPDELQQRLQSGQYDIVLTALKPSASSPTAFLRQLAGNAFVGISCSEATALCSLSDAAPNAAARLNFALQAEEALLNRATLCPLYWQTEYLLTHRSYPGLVFSPFGPLLDISNAA